ncbi:MAG: hypothetical protein Q8Q85_11100 [Gemmatimonadales bacterium]|nr:hypothetical protein [Gemmatimonadales bacterium]
MAGEYARALLILGRRDAAFAVLDSMLQFAHRAYYNPYGIAAVYAALGDADHAFQWLDRAYEQRTIWLIDLALYEEFEPLRSDPRYAALLRRMRLTP